MDGIRWRLRDRWRCQQKGEQMDTSRNGSGLDQQATAGQKALRGYKLHQAGLTLDEAAAQAEGTSRRQIEAVKSVLVRDPGLEPMLASGELTLNAAQRIVGFRQHKPIAAGRLWYGKGDKWVEAANAILQYLNGWKGRDYQFKHVPPREAERRVKAIDEIIDGLQACRADLVNRAVRAQTSMPSH